MAEITITIPDEHLQRVINGLCGQFKYQDLLPDGSSNPETKAQYAKRMVRTGIKNAVKSWEAQQAAEAARLAAIQAVEDEVELS